MICFRCRLELFPEPEPLGDDVQRFVDKSWGEWTCPTPTAIPGVVEHGITAHSPAYEISGEALNDVVEYLIAAAEIADRIGEEGAEQFAALAEAVAVDSKLVEL